MPSTLAEELSDWHPETLETAPPQSPTQPPIPAQRAAQPASPVPTREVTLAEAFASLLAAEQGRTQTAFAPASMPNHVNNDELVEQITNRVIERMTAGAVEQTVVSVAERLVREEIERIKSHAR
jgi:hypothetical protein